MKPLTPEEETLNRVINNCHPAHLKTGFRDRFVVMQERKYIREDLVLAAMKQYASQDKWIQRNKVIKLLQSYSEFLEDEGYMDVDWRAEEPLAIDKYLAASEKHLKTPLNKK